MCRERSGGVHAHIHTDEEGSWSLSGVPVLNVLTVASRLSTKEGGLCLCEAAETGPIILVKTCGPVDMPKPSTLNWK